MRVIAGSARSVPLISVEGLETRPTTDRIKETLFNMLQSYLDGCHFLDLFAGSGQIGIEALSRGAADCVFVEKAKGSCECIRTNLKKTKLEAQGILLASDVMSSVNSLDRQGKHFDLIFMDPPYGKGLALDALAQISRTKIADSETLFIVEASLDEDLTDAQSLGYELVRIKKYKTNQHLFFRLNG